MSRAASASSREGPRFHPGPNAGHGDHARLQQTIAIGTANGGSAADSLAFAANVALAQIYLQQGQYANAVTAAALVPPSFSFVANYIVNLANQGRVSNLIYEGATAGASGETWVVPPAFQGLNDPRVPWTDLKKLAYDTIEFVESTKYTSDASPIQPRVRIGGELHQRRGEPPAGAIPRRRSRVDRAGALPAHRGGQGPFTGSGMTA